MPNVADNIRYRREKMGITQDDLAQMCNCSRMMIWKVEQNRTPPSLALSVDLARVFECTVDDLIKEAQQ